jgi:hypothetical protein
MSAQDHVTYCRYTWMRAPHADFTHLVREALLSASTLCGLPVSPSPMRETGLIRRICPQCAAEAGGAGHTTP